MAPAHIFLRWQRPDDPHPAKALCRGQGVQNIQILDIQNGQVLVIYDEQIDTRQGIDKSGTAYTYTPVWRLYGVMPLEDLLAGSIDFTPCSSFPEH